MKLSWIHASLYTLGICLVTPEVRAQITPDDSLSTQVRQQGNVAEITGGEQAGSNLFHSFQDFSVATGETANLRSAIRSYETYI
ncbi:hypothetical protein NIES4102_19230 [Chondrocystis sp. NIES-4102]|nr:hypothetical protein NIES4102_19230 [Chondrocystis sp. NIES-4102]